MQKRKLFFGIILGSVLSFASCSKDKTDPSNQFSYDQDIYSLSQGIISTNFLGDTMAVSIVELFSDGFTIVWDENNKEKVDSVAGKGEVIYFFLVNDANAEPIIDGTYSYSTKWKGMTWYNGGFYIHYDPEDKNSGYDLKGGTVTVKNSGDNNFEFTFNFTSKEGKTVNGFFKGKLKPFKAEM